MFSRELASDLIFDRFVDRDMYMRYAGGGVGHYKVNGSSDADSGDDGDGADDDEGEDLPEDGEGGFVDAEDEEGYAPL